MVSAPAVKPFRVILLGPPASGKGTQGRRLAASLGLGCLSTGALLREEMETATPLGQLAEPILARGDFLPDDLMCRLLADWLSQQSGGWVLDGFPRSLPQARFLDAWLADKGLQIAAAVALEVPYQELLARIRNRVECPHCRWSGQLAQTKGTGQCPLCAASVVHRPDDNEQNFHNRYHEFTHLTKPVIEHYRQLDLLCACDATAPQDEVAQTILNRFSPTPVGGPIANAVIGS